MILVIDPPWPVYKSGKRNVRPDEGSGLDYETMSIDNIFKLLKMKVLPHKTNTVFLWGVEKFLHAGEAEMEKLGYRRHCRLIWDKLNGISPAFSVRFCHEYITWFYRPTFMPVSPSSRGLFSTVITEKSREHSRKPDKLYNMIEYMFPNEKKIDVFSREKRKGWEQFGNECDKFGSHDEQA